MIDLLLDGLACYRLTRLATKDAIAQPYRDRLEAKGGNWAYFARCSWCTSIWLAPLVLALPRALRRALAVSAIVGLLSESFDN